jgi:hypothetical protein
MAIFQRAVDIYYTFRFLRQLVTPWKDTKAYKLGLVDENGKVLKKASTPEEKDAYTLFFRLVYNIKRLLGKVPGGNSKIASYAAALWLIHENTKMSKEAVYEGFKAYLDQQSITLDNTISESKLWMLKENNLLPGKYKLSEHVVSPTTGEVIAFKGSMILVNEASSVPQGDFAGINIYSVHHISSKQKIYISAEDIYR